MTKQVMKQSRKDYKTMCDTYTVIIDEGFLQTLFIQNLARPPLFIVFFGGGGGYFRHRICHFFQLHNSTCNNVATH